ncbi:uncharacterized protein LOC124808740 isoform X1 [Hydra vulgaris]|uniref:uncharacterized protein LOC124808740 isoform X1 n=1 Tax=Hydra vulgaris TaxID=6087 RepID=UPI001F5E413A|nr:MFS-type transporter clz9-like [Hydra vulgaris]
MLCCVSAVGAYVPPIIIYPRVRMKPSFMDQAPQEAFGMATKNGWINEELFDIWFDHFIQFTQPPNYNTPTLLILDGHSRNNVNILSLLSHYIHKMHPLDISFFKSLNSRYNSIVQSWHRLHPGRPVIEAEFGNLFSTAYGEAASVSKAESGFRKSGIHPFNRLIFTDEDFIAAAVTNQEQNTSNITLSDSQEKVTNNQTNLTRTHSILKQCSSPVTKTFSQLLDESVSLNKTSRKRRSVQHATIVTSSPYRSVLENSKTKKNVEYKNLSKIKIYTQ